MGIVPISLICFAAVTLLLLAAGLVLRDLAGAVGARRPEPIVQRLPSFDDRLGGRTAQGRFDQWFGQLVMESGLGMSPVTAVFFLLMVGLLLGGVFFVVWADASPAALDVGDLIPAAIGGMLGMALGLIFITNRRAHRQRTMQRQLPDALDLLARAVQAGESLEQAMNFAGDETPAPLGIELKRCARQMDMGLSVSAALNSLLQRVHVMEMRLVAAALCVQRETGGKIAMVLERLAQVIRDRLDYRRFFRAATAGGRLGALLVMAAGPTLLMILAWVAPAEYLVDVSNLFSTVDGRLILAAAGGLYVLGTVWILSVLRTDY